MPNQAAPFVEKRVRLRPEFAREVEQVAERDGHTFSWIVRQLLTKWLESKKESTNQ